MGFLGGLFKKKPGGTFFGNLLRGAGSIASNLAGVPGLVGSGANKIELGQTKTNAELLNEQAKAQANGTFAGQPATTSADGTINMTTPLNQVDITTKKTLEVPQPSWLTAIGDKLSYLGQRTTEQTAVGVSDKTLFIIGGGLLAVVLVMMNNKK